MQFSRYVVPIMLTLLLSICYILEILEKEDENLTGKYNECDKKSIFVTCILTKYNFDSYLFLIMSFTYNILIVSIIFYLLLFLMTEKKKLF